MIRGEVVMVVVVMFGCARGQEQKRNEGEVRFGLVDDRSLGKPKWAWR